MRADGRAFLGALEGLLRTVLSALRRAEVLQEGVETATSLMVRVKPPPEAPWRKRFGDARIATAATGRKGSREEREEAALSGLG